MNQNAPPGNYTLLPQSQPGYVTTQPVYSVPPNQQQVYYQPPQTIVINQEPIILPIYSGTTTTRHSKTVCIICSIVFGVFVFIGVIITIVLVCINNARYYYK